MLTGLSDFARYALYYAPEEHEPLWAFGRDWLGVDGLGGVAAAQLAQAAVTAEPAHYTLHGTLKAPFRLAAGRRVEDLVGALEAFCSAQRAIALAPLQLARLGRFLALTPSGDAGALNALAGALVRDFDGFRAPLEAADRQKRLAAGLSSRQRDHLETWGYPYVFEDFRFHVTLTGSLPTEQIDAVETQVRPLVAHAHAGPFRVASVCLFGDPGAGGTFRLLKRFALAR